MLEERHAAQRRSLLHRNGAGAGQEDAVDAGPIGEVQRVINRAIAGQYKVLCSQAVQSVSQGAAKIRMHAHTNQPYPDAFLYLQLENNTAIVP